MNHGLRELIQTIGRTLDGVHIAMCLFDDQDRTLAWNLSFLRLFPEHDGQVFEGEPYRDNLRRFYRARLPAAQQPHIDDYIEAGLARHRHQTEPYEFDHRNLRIRVSSQALEGIGRLRTWRIEAPEPQSHPRDVAPPGSTNVELAPLLDRVPNGLMLCAADGSITWVNDPFAQMYGLRDKSSAIGLKFEQVFLTAWAAQPENPPPPCAAGLNTLRMGLQYTGAPFELPLPGRRICRIVARPSDVGTRFSAHIDISELRQQQQLLAQAERAARESAQRLQHKSTLLQAILENMDQGIAMISAEGAVEFHNRRVLDILDLPEAMLACKPPVQDVIAYQRARGEFDTVPQPLQDYLAPGFSPSSPHTIERRRPNGRLIDIRSIPIDSGGQLRTYTDVTEAREYAQRIEHLASHDELTGLLNRAKFLSRLAAEVALARRQETQFPILYLDLDGFKPINDRHGHAVGDKVLAQVATTLMETARESDFVARLGGDEFAILLRGLDHHGQALQFAQRVDQALSRPFMVGDIPVHIGTSIGIAWFPEHGADPESLMVAADQAMYLAKAERRQHGALRAPSPLSAPE